MNHAGVTNHDSVVFVYTGGRVPEYLRERITHAIIDKSVSVIDEYAFQDCPKLRSVACHKGVEIIRKCAFMSCNGLRVLNLPGVKHIETWAFKKCRRLFQVIFGEKLERIERMSFTGCRMLRHITIPLKEGMDIGGSLYLNIESVWLVEGIRKLIASLHFERWTRRMEMEMNEIHRTVPCARGKSKTSVINEWMSSMIHLLKHFKAEHCIVVNEAMTLLELALWKAKLDESHKEPKRKRAKIDSGIIRKERRVTCGADIIIKNVLPFLQLDE